MSTNDAIPVKGVEVSQEYDFDSLEPIQIPFKYKGQLYYLIEASEGVHIRYKNAMSNSARFTPEGKPMGVMNINDAEPILVAGCVARSNGQGGILKDPNGYPMTVPVNHILTWPSRVVSPLYRKAKEISGIDAEDEEKKSDDVDEMKTRLQGLETAINHLFNSNQASSYDEQKKAQMESVRQEANALRAKFAGLPKGSPHPKDQPSETVTSD